MKRPSRGGLRASSNRRREEFGQIGQLTLWSEGVDPTAEAPLDLVLQWEITAAGPAMQLILPESVDEETGLVAERWQVWLPSAIDLVNVVEYERPLTEDEELDEYVRRLDATASDDGDDGPESA